MILCSRNSLDLAHCQTHGYHNYMLPKWHLHLNDSQAPLAGKLVELTTELGPPLVHHKKWHLLVAGKLPTLGNSDRQRPMSPVRCLLDVFDDGTDSFDLGKVHAGTTVRLATVFHPGNFLIRSTTMNADWMLHDVSVLLAQKHLQSLSHLQTCSN